MRQAAFALQGRNPDVLTCIANLSNDEVFTPPELANAMLDGVAEAWASQNSGKNIWSNKTVRFLDPFTKSGVFLREITKRLTEGLAEEIPDLGERVDHILTNQVFGIAITELTALLARRSVYCSKYADGNHSVAKSFETPSGNIWFERTEHSWTGDKCEYCGASKSEYLRSQEQESHAYALIHSTEPQLLLQEMFGDSMHFDVIIGNPPYQLSDGGFGTSAAPIYHLFVEQAKRLDARLLSMVVPARWFAGGKGLDGFRASMLADDRLRVIEDFPDSNDVFPGTQIKGGICFFLWQRDEPGPVTVRTHDKGRVISTATRPLVEPGADVFIRYNEGVGILAKVMKVESECAKGVMKFELADSKRFSSLVSSRKPFGFDTKFKGTPSVKADSLHLYCNGGDGVVARKDVTVGTALIDEWKVYIPRAGSGSDAFPHPILGRPFVGEPGSLCTETYLCIGPFASEAEAKSVVSYISTRLFRFLVLLHKPTQDATRGVYTFVPKQDFSRPWTDDDLYAKYKISKAEVEFIEKMIRPMDLSDE
jgi:hypothetical protein